MIVLSMYFFFAGHNAPGGGFAGGLVAGRVLAVLAVITLQMVVLGAVGLLLAAPLTVVVYVLVKRLYVRELLDTDTVIPGESGSGQAGH